MMGKKQYRAMLERFSELLDEVSPGELREDLLEIYHSYIIHEHQALPVNFDKMAGHLHSLMDTLRDIESERRRSEPDNGR